ncbi:triacylglycerol lipase [Exophiala aquamarina CBS 119918]|uniref:Carboxylic ester hydrolase n=1 Tax=Exophiala aquamarina CBS 119918 TaxID=1182545 RepID=A0A072PSY7_9EURO|nr:triacylglycerol lipase [Exophiala aquamarina CBS 119918]KEF62842.1 triacylglycerol lipase [Exophiala aquamarina CBS 119918]
MGSIQVEETAPTVTIPQGTIVGTVLEKDLKRKIDAFLGIPYALPPVGELRFKRPVKVPQSSKVIHATAYGPAAPGKQLLVSARKFEYSEDCLTANVFRQSCPSSENSKLLPVMVYLHGGAFNRGNSSMHNTASMVSWSEQPFVAVSFNYRIGSLGFLPSSVSAKEGILNLGLRDQELLFEWVQENIEAFGGDKTDVTLVGMSAGAHSIGHHMMHHTTSNPGPFHRAIIESGSPTSRAVRRYDAAIHEEQFADYLREAGCPADLPESKIFPFLRSLPLGVITRAQDAVFDKYNPSLRWAFQPVIDCDIIPRAPLETWRLGDYYKIPIMTGFNHNEGSLYVDKQMSKPEEFTEFFQTLLPTLSQDDIETIDRLYTDPVSGSSSSSSSADQPYAIPSTMKGQVGAQYRRIEAAYAHYAYVAPVRQTAHLASSHADAPPAYLYHWTPITTVVGGASHGDNMRYETFNPDVVSKSSSQRELAGTLHAYLTSFICNKGDPNALAGEWSDRPTWEAYNHDEPKTMVFGQGNEELVGGGVGVAAKMDRDPWADKECQFWWDKVELSQQ